MKVDLLADFVEEYQTPEQYVQSHIDFLKEASQSYTIPRWYKRPHYVEVWIEKPFLKDRDVMIVVNRGYSGWSFLYENCMRLQEIKRSGQRETSRDSYTLFR